MFENLSLRAKIILGSAVSLSFLILLGMISLNSIKGLTETNNWVDHGHQILTKTAQLESAAVDMETGMRGYLLAGKEQFLEPYTNGQKVFHQLAEDLKLLVTDNPSQVSLMGEIENSIIEWQKNVTDDVIALRRDIGDAKSMNDMALVISEEKGKKFVDNFRSKINLFASREQKLLTKREADLKASTDLKQIRDAIEWIDHTQQVIQDAMKIEIAALNMETGMRGFLLAGKDNFLDPYNQGRNTITHLISELKVRVQNNPEQVMLLVEIDSIISQWENSVAENQIILRREIGNAKTMDDIADIVAQARGKKYFDKFRALVANFSKIEQRLMTSRQAAAAETVTNTTYTLIFGIIIAILVSIPTAYMLSHSIMLPFQNIFKGLQRFSSKELQDLSVLFSDIVLRMSKSAGRVASIANNIDNVSQNLSQISNRQASSVEQTSASTEEISGMVKINVQSAEESRDLSKQVGEKMTALDAAMSEIAESNYKITELVKIIGEIGAKTKIIDEIVFQTKLLSFNASVEAERAGEHGRGFAVVAQEVGNLAQMSGKAATDIAAIVRQSVGEAESIAKENTTRVENGNAIVAETRVQSQAVVEGANKIFEASNEQARGIQEISSAVESINKATQHAASIADQASGSSSELTKQAEDLNRLVRHLNGFLRGHDANNIYEQHGMADHQDEFDRSSFAQLNNDAMNDPNQNNTSVNPVGNNKEAWNRL